MRHYRIYVTAKEGIFDPAGATAHAALNNLGFTGVESVKIGKYLELECADELDHAAVTKMCELLLANPVIEDFRIEE